MHIQCCCGLSKAIFHHAILSPSAGPQIFCPFFCDLRNWNTPRAKGLLGDFDPKKWIQNLQQLHLSFVEGHVFQKNHLFVPWRPGRFEGLAQVVKPLTRRALGCRHRWVHPCGLASCCDSPGGFQPSWFGHDLFVRFLPDANGTKFSDSKKMPPNTGASCSLPPRRRGSPGNSCERHSIPPQETRRPGYTFGPVTDSKDQ